MMTNNLSLYPILILGPIMSISLFHTRFLICLLNLEMIILSLILSSMTIMFGGVAMDSSSIMFMLTVGASETCVGLACLVMMTRTTSSDYMKSMNMALY